MGAGGKLIFQIIHEPPRKNADAFQISLRAVQTTDFMTADFWYPPKEFIKKVSLRITNEVDGVSRVVYDLTSKPPGECLGVYLDVYTCRYGYLLNSEQVRLRWNSDTVPVHKRYFEREAPISGTSLVMA